MYVCMYVCILTMRILYKNSTPLPLHERVKLGSLCFYLWFNVCMYVCMYVVSSPVQRVAVVDYDVHHGNGTEQCFWNDPDALFISIHQVTYPKMAPWKALAFISVVLYYRTTTTRQTQEGSSILVRLFNSAVCVVAVYVRARVYKKPCASAFYLICSYIHTYIHTFKTHILIATQ